jgi:hypothetical protein
MTLNFYALAQSLLWSVAWRFALAHPELSDQAKVWMSSEANLDASEAVMLKNSVVIYHNRPKINQCESNVVEAHVTDFQGRDTLISGMFSPKKSCFCSNSTCFLPSSIP